MAKIDTKGYTAWFDTKYYHILYKDRNYNEAKHFMEALTSHLQLSPNAKLLDLACGRGRHSVYLNKLGFQVTGTDLSESSIKQAQKYEKTGLNFRVHDMSEPLNEKFDAVFNLFTSFGYFEDEEDNLKTLKAIKTELNAEGYGVIDFMNAHKVMKELVSENTKTVNGIEFHLKRWIENGFILKEICFEDEGEAYSYQERVKALTLKDFENYFDKANIQLKEVFGDYQLNPFDKETSERLILIFQ